MCGITGLISFTPISPKIVSAMTDVIRHRGPDDEGYALFTDDNYRIVGGGDTPDEVYKTDYPHSPKMQARDVEAHQFNLALGHRRLSIVDVSPAGHQPMCSEDQRYWIVFNGEVYNHIELRLDLEKLGYRFRSHSDTEVILAAYQEWGSECLSKFNGMFAILIFDRVQRKLIAARDRFGVKPLYYRVSSTGIAFASEIKQFTQLPDWEPIMNGQRVYDFLNWGITDHTDETLFQGVFQLRGGEYVELDLTQELPCELGAKLPVVRWYALQPMHFSGTFEDATQGFLEHLTDSVALRLRADVPIGSCLSGGLDSSSIVCLMNRSLEKQGAATLQKTFSACVDVKEFDERDYIDEVVRATRVDAHYVYPEISELFATSDEIVWHQDEPFGSTSIYAQWHVFKLAAQNHVKVMLDGQGADEQLAGYHTFFGPYLAGLFRQGRWLKLYHEIRAIQHLHGYSKMMLVKRMANVLLPEFLRQKLRGVAGKANTQPNWMNLNLLGAKAQDPYVAIGNKAASLQNFSEAQLTASNLQMLLHWEDRDSMAHSIESRVPFLDYHLVEYVLGLPDGYKLEGGVTKRVLRAAMRNILPEKIQNRMDKLGFVTPEELWLRKEASDQFRQALDMAINDSQGVLNANLKVMLEDMIAGRVSFNFLIWRAISFGAWIRKFNVRVH